MKCPKCNGCGKVSNTRYYNLGSAIAYERGVSPIKTCKECNGTGFVLGNYKDIADRLLVTAKGGEPIKQKEAQQMLDVITKAIK